MKTPLLATLTFLLIAAAPLRAAGTWAFAPERDTFSPDALFDLRSLNEPLAGQSGWVRTTPDGDFVRGDGEPIRFWAVGSDFSVERNSGKRPLWEAPLSPDPAHTYRWLAKRGVNMIRLHGRINPRLPKTGNTPDLTTASPEELAWFWHGVAAAKKSGIYTTLSPYWANTMASNDAAWGTDWQGQHHGLLFFDPQLQTAYKAWLRQLFTTPTPILDGKTLAEEPALAIFQIQNEDSLLFWTFNAIKSGPRARLGQLFADWATDRYGSIDKALAAWNLRLAGDHPADGILDFPSIWEFTAQARAQGLGDTRRHADTLEFLTTCMRDFNTEIARFIHEDLGCPVLVNDGNWKTADDLLLNDAERYSYTAGDISAVNRYYGGIHQGKQRGWAILEGDVFQGDSVTLNNPLGFPINLKQTTGQPMLVPESSWVFPSQFSAEGPLLIAAYSSLTGFDTYYWFMHATDEWTPPQSANGYLPSQQKWIMATPDTLGQFPAAALLFRRGDLKRGSPVVNEHRPLTDLWQRKEPLLHEISGFDPNRDASDAPRPAVPTAIDPFAYFVGPVQVTYDSPTDQTTIAPDLAEHIQHLPGGGTRVTANTGQLVLDTQDNYVTLDSPRAQGVTGHFAPGRTLALSTVTFTSHDAHSALLAVSLDDQPLATSAKILVQAGTLTRPTDWQTEPADIPVGKSTIPGQRVLNYGRAPWQVANADAKITLANLKLTRARALDANGLPLAEVHLTRDTKTGTVTFNFPSGSLYVIVE